MLWTCEVVSSESYATTLHPVIHRLHDAELRLVRTSQYVGVKSYSTQVTQTTLRKRDYESRDPTCPSEKKEVLRE